MKRRRHIGAAFFRVGYGAGGRALDFDEGAVPSGPPTDGEKAPQNERWPDGEPNDVSPTLTFEHNNDRMPYHEGALEVEADVLAPERYPARPYDTGEKHRIRDVAYGLKTAEPWALEIASAAMASLLPPGAVLVPLPSSKGSTDANRALAEAVAERSDARVADVLTGPVRPSQHERETAGLPRLGPEEVGTQIRPEVELPDGPVVLIDNVAASRATGLAAEKLFGRPVQLLTWADTAATIQPGMEQAGERGFDLHDLDTGSDYGPLEDAKDWDQAYAADPYDEGGGSTIHLGAAENRGIELNDKKAGYGADELPQNPDGTVTLYHGTTAEGAQRIIASGMLQSAGEPDVYLTTAKQGTGYGDGTVVAVDVDPALLELDDEFPDGRQDFRFHTPGKRVRISNPRVAAGLPAVGNAARALAGEIARTIESAQRAVDLSVLRPEEREYMRYWRSEELENAEQSLWQLTRGTRSFRLIDYLPESALKTERAKEALRWTYVALTHSDEAPDRRGWFAPGYNGIHIVLRPEMLLSSPAENMMALEPTLTHEIRHAIDWAYHGSDFTRKRHPGGQENEKPQTRAWWTTYLSNPTELMAWAGNVAHSLDHRPRGWEDLKAQLAQFTIHVLNTRTAQVEMRDPGGEVEEVPVLDLIPPDARPRFLQMILKAYEQLHPRGGAGVNPWDIRREDTVNRKKIPPDLIGKILQAGYLYQVRDHGVDKAEFPDWQSWVRGNTSAQLEMELENNYNAYQLLQQLPKNQLGEYPSLEDMIERWRGLTGIDHAPRPQQEEPWDFEEYHRRREEERAEDRARTAAADGSMSAGYVYHATTEDALPSIAGEGLVPHDPWHGTDQETWPDGSTERRVYFSGNENVVTAFYPEHSRPATLRAPASSVPGLKPERGTGDLVTTRVVPPAALEVRVPSGWLPLTQVIEPEHGYTPPADLDDDLDDDDLDDLTAARELPVQGDLYTLDEGVPEAPYSQASEWPKGYVDGVHMGRVASSEVIRPAGWSAANDVPGSWTRAQHMYRGMTSAEYNASVGAGKPIQSTGGYSATGEGTNFAPNAEDAESYVNFGRDDPRKTGQSTYLVEAAVPPSVTPARDGYYKIQEPVVPTRVWEMFAEDDQVVAHRIATTASVAADVTFRNELTGSTRGQTDGRLLALRDGKPLGFIDWSQTRPDIIHVKMIEVLPEARRQGIGSALMHQLRREFPGAYVDEGYKTDEGAALMKTVEPQGMADPRIKEDLDRAFAEVDEHWPSADLLSLAAEFEQHGDPRAQVLREMAAHDFEGDDWQKVLEAREQILHRTAGTSDEEWIDDEAQLLLMSVRDNASEWARDNLEEARAEVARHMPAEDAAALTTNELVDWYVQLNEMAYLDDAITSWEPFQPQEDDLDAQRKAVGDRARQMIQGHREAQAPKKAQRRPWLACDLDGTILSEAPGMASRGEFGEPLPGAMKALRELESLGWRISIFTARFTFGHDPEALKAAIEQTLRSYGVPFTDVWTGTKPPADYFVDNKAIHFGGDWGEVLTMLTAEGLESGQEEEGDDEHDAGNGLIDWSESGNDFGNDGMGSRRDKSFQHNPSFEKVVY